MAKYGDVSWATGQVETRDYLGRLALNLNFNLIFLTDSRGASCSK